MFVGRRTYGITTNPAELCLEFVDIVSTLDTGYVVVSCP
jgi:hypothetical protein